MAPAVTAGTTGNAREFIRYCVCVRCGGELEVASDDELTCAACGASYPIVQGVLRLLPGYDDETRARYLANYNAIAKADLEHPFEENRKARHSTLLKFIGDVRGKRVLDIGSSDAGYLRSLDAAERVAVDLAAPFLEAIPAGEGIVRVCTDAELLPIKRDCFDVVVIADVLEHLLAPERLVQRLTGIVTPKTRVIVHVPWEEDISVYKDAEW